MNKEANAIKLSDLIFEKINKEFFGALSASRQPSLVNILGSLIRAF